ncbi:putative RING-H2 finger protein ATL71 [Lolium perenne]|uniref:putative RING-H2 finger protein ATL71 n=1 Tax=Lolium perenne TaxID=4522 RepID=UPI0021F61AEF|nr:putative RING-H2 finger protein ATL71 [Lolium perenne]
MFGSELNLLSAALGFGMTAVFIAFVCARFFCCRAPAADDGGAQPPLDFDADFPADLSRQMEHAHCGLEPWVISAIPTMKYNFEAFHSKDDAQCSICLGEYNEKEILRIIPTCRHNFHLICLDVWLRKHTTCPMCRVSLKELPDGKADVIPARGIPESPTIPAVNPTPEWFLPTHRVHGGQQNSTGTQETVEMVIEIRQ